MRGQFRFPRVSQYGFPMLPKFPIPEILINSPTVHKKLYKTIILNSQKISKLPKEPTKTFRTIRSYSFFTLHTRSEYFSRAMKHFSRFLTGCQFRFPGVSQYRFPMLPKFPMPEILINSPTVRKKLYKTIILNSQKISKLPKEPTKTFRTIRGYSFFTLHTRPEYFSRAMKHFSRFLTGS